MQWTIPCSHLTSCDFLSRLSAAASARRRSVLARRVSWPVIRSSFSILPCSARLSCFACLAAASSNFLASLSSFSLSFVWLGERTSAKRDRVRVGACEEAHAGGCTHDRYRRTWASLSRVPVELAVGFALDDIESIRDTFIV